MSTPPILGMLRTKFYMGDKLFTLYDDKIVQGEVVAISVTDAKIVDGQLVAKGIEIQETYTLKLYNGNTWSRTNNVKSLFKTHQEVLENIQIKFINDETNN